jgi:2,3-bisphosphoglycerate-dependent phosphoglycerate mutase
MSYPILLRHGKSSVKSGNRFVGWLDVPLSNKGIEEALDCAVKLKDIELNLASVSKLVRTQETLFVILSGQKKQECLSMKKQIMKAG